MRNSAFPDEDPRVLKMQTIKQLRLSSGREKGGDKQQEATRGTRRGWFPPPLLYSGEHLGSSPPPDTRVVPIANDPLFPENNNQAASRCQEEKKNELSRQRTRRCWGMGMHHESQAQPPAL